MKDFDARKDYYSALGLSRDAYADDIKNAFRQLAKQWHPDINKSPEALAKFETLSEAYSVLSHPQKRAAYDKARFIENRARAPMSSQPSTTLDTGTIILGAAPQSYCSQQLQEKYRSPAWNNLSLAEKKAFRAQRLAQSHGFGIGWALLVPIAVIGLLGYSVYHSNLHRRFEDETLPMSRSLATWKYHHQSNNNRNSNHHR